MFACSFMLQFDVECYRDDLLGEDDHGIAEAFLSYRVRLATCVEDAIDQALVEIISEYNDMCDPYDEDSPVPLLLEDLVVDHGEHGGLNRVYRNDEVVAYINIYPVEVPR